MRTIQRVEYFNIINCYIKADNLNDFNYIDIVNIDKQDLERIKQFPLEVLHLFIDLLYYPYYKKELPMFLKKNPDWLEYFI